MQLTILPTSFPCTPQFEVHGQVLPAKEVGGDFYDIYRLEDGRLGLVIARRIGQGDPGRAVHDGVPDPAQGHRDRDGLPRRRPDRGQHAAACGEPGVHVRHRVLRGVQSPHRVLTYANAGHEPPVLRHSDGSTEALPFTGGVPLGIVDDMKFEERTSTLAPGEFVFLFTDGVTEALNESEEEFGNERVRGTIAEVGPGGTAPRSARYPGAHGRAVHGEGGAIR